MYGPSRNPHLHASKRECPKCGWHHKTTRTICLNDDCLTLLVEVEEYGKLKEASK